jgi:hypothetical protein
VRRHCASRTSRGGRRCSGRGSRCCLSKRGKGLRGSWQRACRAGGEVDHRSTALQSRREEQPRCVSRARVDNGHSALGRRTRVAGLARVRLGRPRGAPERRRLRADVARPVADRWREQRRAREA